nr:hypothetical protein BaRGS_018898 [Batillaria attramentaria]
MINIFNLPAMHMEMSAFGRQHVLQEGRQGAVHLLHAGGGATSVITSQRYVFMSSVKSAIGKAANISTLRISNVNVWQDLVSSKLNFFFSVLEPPPVPGLPPQPSALQALNNLAAAIQAGMSITIKHPIRHRQMQVVPDSLKSWNSLQDLWHKVIPVKQAEGTGALPQVVDDNVDKAATIPMTTQRPVTPARAIRRASSAAWRSLCWWWGCC